MLYSVPYYLFDFSFWNYTSHLINTPAASFAFQIINLWNENSSSNMFRFFHFDYKFSPEFINHHPVFRFFYLEYKFSPEYILHHPSVNLDEYLEWLHFDLMIRNKLLTTHVWNLTFLWTIFYSLLAFSLVMYTIPLVTSFTAVSTFKNQKNYTHISFDSFHKFLVTPVVIIFLLTIVWTAPTISAWFGQLTMSTFQRSLTLLSISSFLLLLYVYSTTLVFNTKEIYDFMIIIFNTFVWTCFLFYANNIFTIIFFIEILSSLTILILITSAFSSSYHYNVTNFSKSLYFHQLMPKSILNSLIFFFWMSLLSSLLLFLFLIVFYTSIFTFEFSLIDACLNHLSNTATNSQFLTNLIVMFVFIAIVFLKCGLVPLFIWKPIVFKGLTLHAIFFYICYYYYFLLMFLVYVFIVDLYDILWYNRLTINLILMLGVAILFSILIESFYLKSFLAMSSILNTLLIFIGLSSIPTTSGFFYL